ncbi:MAG TPA: hypothetical protein VMY34_04365, partial [Acidimicrobiales bacterium]|nr:hypothetical protein [Acidimicrobiales bacterium]
MSSDWSDVRSSLDSLSQEARLQLLGAAVEQASDAILITEATPLDPPGPVAVYANASFLRMTRLPLTKVIGS